MIKNKNKIIVLNINKDTIVNLYDGLIDVEERNKTTVCSDTTNKRIGQSIRMADYIYFLIYYQVVRIININVKENVVIGSCV